MHKTGHHTFLTLFKEISEMKVKKFTKKFTKSFLDGVLNLMFSEIVVHHSHVSGNIIGYAHNFCNHKIKENYKQTISVFAHNLFRFDFFFVLKGLRMSAWKTK